jgi:hypothetical protein
VGAVLRPVGPLPPAVYWRRRAVVVAVLALVLVFAGRMVGADATSSNGAAGAAATPTPRHHATTPAASHPATSATRSTPAATAAGVALCPNSAIAVTVATDAPDYAAAVIPGITITVTNTGPVPCRRDIGSAALGLVVSSGTDRVWSSDDCQHAEPAVLRTLAPGKAVAQTVAWTRHRSAPTCPTTPTAAAQPGTYQVVGHAGTATSRPAVFRLG